MLRPPGLTLFPYTTLFRSEGRLDVGLPGRQRDVGEVHVEVADPELVLRAQLRRGRGVLGAIADAGEDRHADRDEGSEHDSQRSEEHTSELQSQSNLVCRLL